jgi:hypothetical protein
VFIHNSQRADNSEETPYQLRTQKITSYSHPTHASPAPHQHPRPRTQFLNHLLIIIAPMTIRTNHLIPLRIRRFYLFKLRPSLHITISRHSLTPSTKEPNRTQDKYVAKGVNYSIAMSNCYQYTAVIENKPPKSRTLLLLHGVLTVFPLSLSNHDQFGKCRTRPKTRHSLSATIYI